MKWTLLGVFAGAIAWFVTIVFDVELFEHFVAFTRQLEFVELDELFLLLLLAL